MIGWSNTSGVLTNFSLMSHLKEAHTHNDLSIQANACNQTDTSQVSPVVQIAQPEQVVKPAVQIHILHLGNAHVLHNLAVLCCAPTTSRRKSDTCLKHTQQAYIRISGVNFVQVCG
jgi:hypothetical protein